MNTNKSDILTYMLAQKRIKARICKSANKFGAAAVASALGVHVSHIYNVCSSNRPISPTLANGMIANGVYYITPRNRQRFATDIPAGVDAVRYRAKMRVYHMSAVVEAGKHKQRR